MRWCSICHIFISVEKACRWFLMPLNFDTILQPGTEKREPLQEVILYELNMSCPQRESLVLTPDRLELIHTETAVYISQRI